MSFTLYNAPQSTCSQRVRFVLNAKKISFAEIKLDLLAGDQLKPDYLALNPNGVVPTLDHDGAIVIDSSVIIEYLDEVVPTPESFTPRDPVTRARMRALMRFIDEMPAAAVRVPTFNLAFRKERRPVATRRRELARRHRVDAGDRAHGGPWSGDCLAGPSARRALVRRHSRASGISADVLSGLAAYGAISAFALSRVKATEPIRERQSAVLGFAEGTGGSGPCPWCAENGNDQLCPA
jgi:glutathione S-transferase